MFQAVLKAVGLGDLGGVLGVGLPSTGAAGYTAHDRHELQTRLDLLLRLHPPPSSAPASSPSPSPSSSPSPCPFATLGNGPPAPRAGATDAP